MGYGGFLVCKWTYTRLESSKAERMNTSLHCLLEWPHKTMHTTYKTSAQTPNCSSLSCWVPKKFQIQTIQTKATAKKKIQLKSPQLFQIYILHFLFSWHPFEKGLSFPYPTSHGAPWPWQLLITPEKWAMQVVWSKEDLSSCLAGWWSKLRNPQKYTME